MSIEEFLDGMPTFDERNFSKFYPRRIPVHKKKNITITTDTPSEQVLDQQVTGPIHKKWDLKIKDKTRESNEMGEEPGPSSRKRPKI